MVADIEYSPEKADIHNEILAVKRSGAQAMLTATFLTDAALIAEDASVLTSEHARSSTRPGGSSTRASSRMPATASESI